MANIEKSKYPIEPPKPAILFYYTSTPRGGCGSKIDLSKKLLQKTFLFLRIVFQTLWTYCIIKLLLTVGFFGARHIQYVLIFIGIVIAYGIRTILNVAVIAMINGEDSSDAPTYPKWADEKNIMLSSFFWGYVSLQVFAGQLAKNYGPKYFLTAAMLICSIFTVLVPFFGAWFGYSGVIICRVVQGMSQGFLYPSVHTLLSSWVRLVDRATIGTFVYAGGPLGNVIAMPITGSIAGSSCGWPAVFYLYGTLGIVWSSIWFWIGSDSPAKCRNISSEERQYLEAGQTTDNGELVSTPWRSILTSLPFWAVLVAHCGQNWGYWTLLTEIPSYMENILKFKIASNSYLSALPYLVLWLLSLAMSPLADWVIVKNMVSLESSRKIFNSIGLFVPALALTSLTFVDETEKTVIILLLVLAVGFNAGIFSGFHVNHIDISPTHSGTLMGITNTASNLCGIVAPLIVDVVKSASGYAETEKSLWNIVFLIAGMLYVISGIFYIYGASGEVQPWDHNEINEEGSKSGKISTV